MNVCWLQTSQQARTWTHTLLCTEWCYEGEGVPVWGRWRRGEERGRQGVVGNSSVLLFTLRNENSAICFLKLGVNPASSGGSMLLSLRWFGVQTFNQLHLYCQGCKKKIAVQICALYFVYVKPAVMFDFCGENNLKKHHLNQTDCKQTSSIQ